MGKSIQKKHKRQFFGNRFNKNAHKIILLDDATCNASSSKLKDISSSESKENNIPLCVNRIFDLEILLNVFSEVSCPSCCAIGLNLCEDSRYGLCSHRVLKYSKCDFFKGFASSKKVVNLTEINFRFVYVMRQIGKGFSAAYKLCATLNMPGISKSPYIEHENRLLGVISKVAEKSMEQAASELSEIKETDTNECTECGVSVDGTCQRRGYTSMNGCVAAISVDTGKVIDIEVMSSYCPKCKTLQNMAKNIVYDSLKADHVCQCNFEGSASKMETVGASRIFLRSERKRKLKYTEYYRDGDSKSYSNVKDTYGTNSVTKLECIGHFQKRVGSRLCKLKAKVKCLLGKGKLTDTFIDRLQNYYGIAVRSNVGDLKKMQQNVIAALSHCASNSEKPMHGQCPIDKDSWCFYQRAAESGAALKEKYSGLSNDTLNKIKPTYLELCSIELLEKCLHGKTQNANECLNGSIWQRLPKEVYVGLRTMKLGVYDAVVNFNDGYKGCSDIKRNLNIDPGFFTLKAYNHLDCNRIRDAKRHSTAYRKKRRKVLRAIRKKKSSLLDTKKK